MNTKRNLIGLLLLAIFTVLGLSACSISDNDVADPGFTTLRYAGGFGEGSKFKECVKAGSKLASDDDFYRYPNTQREDVFDSDHFVDSNGDGVSEGSADHPDLVVNVGGVDMSIKAKVQFFLNTDCSPVEAAGRKFPGGTIQAYHELVGKTRHAYFNKDGSYENGWIWAMDNYITSAVSSLTTPEVRKFSPQSAWENKDGQWETIAKAVQDNLQKAVDDGMQTDLSFYHNFQVRIFNIQPDSDYQQQFKDRASAKNKADTAELNKKAQIAEAQAKAAVAREEAKVKRAEIEGYGGFSNYKCIYLADHGLNCAQPQYVVGGTK